MIHGEPVTVLETQNKHWFAASELLKGGFETLVTMQDTRFVEDFIEMAPNSEAATFAEHLVEIYTRPNPLGNRGGDEGLIIIYCTA